MFRHLKEPRTISIIGAPLTHGQPYVGTDMSPALLRKHSLLSKLAALGWRVDDNPDLSFPLYTSDKISHSKAKNSLTVGKAAKKIADAVQEKAELGNFALTLGGDHSISIGTLAGILKARPDTGVLWIDAHADLNTPEISESGNMHGMPVGLLLKGMFENHASIPGLEWLAQPDAPRLPPENIVYVGLRDVDRAERDAIFEMGILAFTMYDIDHLGIGTVMDRAISHLLEKDPNRPIHVSYDIDAIDPSHAPATGTAVRGGLTFREAHHVAESIVMSGALCSADIVELNPTLSDGPGMHETCDMGLQIITSLTGKSII